MNLRNNQPGHEPAVSQQFKYLTCAGRVMIQLHSGTQSCTDYLLIDSDTFIHYLPMYV